MEGEEKNDSTESVGLSTDKMNQMSREELVEYLVENLGDEMDPEDIRQMSEEKVNEFKILLQNSLAQGQTSMVDEDDDEEEEEDGDDDGIIFLEEVKKKDNANSQSAVVDNIIPTEIQIKQDENPVNRNIPNEEENVSKVTKTLPEPSSSFTSAIDGIDWEILSKINFDLLADSGPIQSSSSSSSKPTQAVIPQVKRLRPDVSPEQVKDSFDPSFNLPIKPNHLVVCSRKLWLNHLPKSVGEEAIVDMFGVFGRIESIVIHSRRSDTHRFAHVTMVRREDAVRSLEGLHEAKLHGESVSISWSPPQALRKYEWINFWDADKGIFYIPWTKLSSNIPLDKFQDGGTIVKFTLPSSPCRDDGVQRIRRQRLPKQQKREDDDQPLAAIKNKGGTWYSGDQEPPSSCVQGSSSSNNDFDGQNQFWAQPPQSSGSTNDSGQGGGTSWSWPFQPVANFNNSFTVQNNNAFTDNPFCLQNVQSSNPFCMGNPSSVNPFCVQNNSMNNNNPFNNF